MKRAYLLLVFSIILPLLSSCEGDEDCLQPWLDGSIPVSACILEPAGCSDGEIIEVSRVIDGDTVKLVDGRTVRMLGINAPEMPSNPGDPNLIPVTCMGPLAREYLSDHLEGQDVCLRYPDGEEHEDVYGRTLAYIYYGGMNVSTLMVATGHACVYDSFREPICNQDLTQAETQAQSDQLGLWGVCARLHGDPCGALR
jgi:endonuclease YncB( thermonuclease family)